MRCWHCNAELIWGGDHDIDEEDDYYQMETNLTCPQCDCLVLVYFPKDSNDGGSNDNEEYTISVELELPVNENGNNVVHFNKPPPKKKH